MESTRENKHSLLAWLLTPSPPPSHHWDWGRKQAWPSKGGKERGRTGSGSRDQVFLRSHRSMRGFLLGAGDDRAGFPPRPLASRRGSLQWSIYIYSRRNLKIDASRINCPEPERNSTYGIHSFSLFLCGQNHRICSLQLHKFGGEGDTEAKLLHTSTS